MDPCGSGHPLEGGGHTSGPQAQSGSRPHGPCPHFADLTSSQHFTLHPCLDLYGFGVLSNSDRAPVFLSRLVQDLCWVWLEACCVDFEPCLEAVEPSSRTGLECASFGFGSGWRPLASFRWSLGWMPPILNKWACIDQAGASLGWVWLVAFLFLRNRTWRP